MQSQCGLSGAESSRWEAGHWHKGGDGFPSRQDICPPLKQQEFHGMPCVEWLKSARVSSWSQKWDGGILNKTHAVRRKEKAGVLGRPPTMSTTEAGVTSSSCFFLIATVIPLLLQLLLNKSFKQQRDVRMITSGLLGISAPSRTSLNFIFIYMHDIH